MLAELAWVHAAKSGKDIAEVCLAGEAQGIGNVDDALILSWQFLGFFNPLQGVESGDRHTHAILAHAHKMIVTHPDIKRSADKALLASMRTFQLTQRAASIAAQDAGRYPDIDSRILALYNNSVPFGTSQLVDHPVFAAEVNHVPREELIAELMELVVPTRSNQAS